MAEIIIRGHTALVKALDAMNSKGIPYAVKNGLTSAAFEARKAWQTEIRQSFTLRNQYTERSIRVEKAQPMPGVGGARAFFSVVGSVAPYMDEQEEGATIRANSKHKPIPAPAAAGQAAGGHRTRVVRAGKRLSAISGVTRPNQLGGRRQQNAVALAVAKRKGQKFVLLNRKRGGKGLFEGTFGKRGARVRLVYDLSRGSVVIKPEPTLQRALKTAAPKIQRAMSMAFLQQLKRHMVAR